jgi:uncharacterized protein (DUF885 family)
MSMKGLLFGFFAAVAALNTSALAADSLDAVLKDYATFQYEQDPIQATRQGVRIYDDRLPDTSLAGHAAAVEKRKAFIARLDALEDAALSGADRLNRDLLRVRLAQSVEGEAFGGKYLAITNRAGPHTFLAGLPDDLPFFTKADYESYVARLNAAPAYVAGTIEKLRGGIETGWTQPCAPMEGYEKSVAFHVVSDPTKSALYKPFEKRPAPISAGEWKKLSAAAARAIGERAVPAIKDFAAFYEAEYRPACRKDIAASTFPDGGAYYAYRARVFTTTDKTPEQIHALGLSEVARIRKEMSAVMRKAKFEGDFKGFQEYLRTDPKFYAKSAQELMEKNATVAKKIDGELPKLFTRIPRAPYTLKEVPADIAEGTTTAYYEAPAPDGSSAGVYRVNTSKLDTRPLYEIEALTLHEAAPGHHFQIALAQELEGLPEFRRYGSYTAFTEGWGLYAESLGLDVGFYQDPYADFGRLSYEMWRACRLVVDTGMHAKGWTRLQAMEFMKANTALSEHNIKAEIDRYIAWPGQALAYKIGELKIKELRARAAKALGPKFDLRRFHDAVLGEGALPLSILERNIDAWIAAEKTRQS